MAISGEIKLGVESAGAGLVVMQHYRPSRWEPAGH
jgi:hypothetical protein